VGGSGSQQMEARPVSNNISMLPIPQQVNFSLSHIGAGSSAIAAAASQAIAATQQVAKEIILGWAADSTLCSHCRCSRADARPASRPATRPSTPASTPTNSASAGSWPAPPSRPSRPQFCPTSPKSRRGEYPLKLLAC